MQEKTSMQTRSLTSCARVAGVLALVAIPGATLGDAPAASTAVVSQASAAGAADGTSDACPAVMREVDRALAAREPASPDERNHLHTFVSRAASESSSCAARVDAALTRAPCDAPGFAVVASAAFNAALFEPAWTARHVQRGTAALAAGDDACMKAIVPGVQNASRVDASVAEALEALAAHREDENAPKAAFLVLGTVARRARALGDAALGERLDAVLARNLATSPAGNERLTALEAAGNAGCGSCLPAIEAALSDDAPAVRRAAVAALRFQDGARAARTLCARLRQDGDASVREHAAWSASWAEAHLDAQAACLEAAAQSDADGEVRRTAARSLGVLAERSAEAEGAVGRMISSSSPEQNALGALAVLEQKGTSR